MSHDLPSRLAKALIRLLDADPAGVCERKISIENRPPFLVLMFDEERV